jgi:hypothetical protein
MLPTPLLRLDSFSQSSIRTQVENALSQRNHPNRSLINENYDMHSKQVSSAFETQTSAYGLTDRHCEDFAPTEMFDERQYAY